MTAVTQAARYRLDRALSRFTVQAFAGGVLSFLAHSPTFAVRDFDGALEFDRATLENLRLDVVVRAESLDLVDQVRLADRQEIEDRMRREVLETGRYPEVRVQMSGQAAARVADQQFQIRLDGSLSLHGVTQPLRTDILLRVFPDGVRVQGDCALRLAEFGIRPVTAVGGTIRLQDRVQVAFDLAALPSEGS